MSAGSASPRSLFRKPCRVNTPYVRYTPYIFNLVFRQGHGEGVDRGGDAGLVLNSHIAAGPPRAGAAMASLSSSAMNRPVRAPCAVVTRSGSPLAVGITSIWPAPQTR